MSALQESIERAPRYAFQTPGHPEYVVDEIVLAAARRWSEFPTDDDLGVAAEAMAVLIEQAGQGATLTTQGLARAALAAVRARETGETET